MGGALAVDTPLRSRREPGGSLEIGMTNALNAVADAPASDAPLDAYGRALEQAAPLRVAADPAALLQVLLARDAVAVEPRGTLTAEASARLLRLDETLRSQASELSVPLAEGVMETWRETFTPPPDAWWWHLDAISTQAAEKKSPWWSVLTGIVLTISASLTAEIARRFLSNGPDFYGAFTTISQGAVTLLAGSSLTQKGRRWLAGWFHLFGGSPERSLRGYTVLAAGVLTLVGLFRLSLPWIALHYYDARGRELFEQRRLHDAIEHFQRAVNLAPEKDQPHFDLADAFEEVLDIDKAIVEYQAAIQLNPNNYQAYNNLARLYLVKRKDPEGAMRALRKGFIRVGEELKKQGISCPAPSPLCQGADYTLHKNLAWVNVTQKWYRLARLDLDAARNDRPDGGGAYCLLAQVEVAEEHLAEATAAWGRCLGAEATRKLLSGEEKYRTEDIEETWIAMAQEWESNLKGVELR